MVDRHVLVHNTDCKHAADIVGRDAQSLGRPLRSHVEECCSFRVALSPERYRVIIQVGSFKTCSTPLGRAGKLHGPLLPVAYHRTASQ